MSSSDSSSSHESGKDVSDGDSDGEDTIRTEIRALQDALRIVTALIDSEEPILPPVRTLQEQSRIRHGPYIVGRLARMKLEFEALQSLEKPLAQARSKLQRRHQQTKNALVPVDMLPDKLLEIIFAYDVREGFFSVEKGDVNKFIVDVSHVCGRWRKIALQCTALWTHLDLRWGKSHAKTWLLRSGDRLLDIAYTAPCPYLSDSGFDNHLDQPWLTCEGRYVMDGPCLDHTHRWGSITFHWFDGSHFQTLGLALRQFDLPAVHTLTLRSEDGFGRSGLDFSWVKEKMPCLRSLDLDYESDRTQNLREIVPNLRALKFQGIDRINHNNDLQHTAIWPFVLESNTLLEIAQMSWESDHYDGPSIASSKTLIGPRLYELNLMWQDWGVCINAMCCLQFPMLRSLSIEEGDLIDRFKLEKPRPDVALTKAMLIFVSYNIDLLGLFHSSFPWQFVNLPMLEEIKLRMLESNLALVVRAMGVSASDLVFPKLRSLSLYADKTGSPEIWSDIRDFLDDRAMKMELLGIDRKPLYQLRTYRIPDCSEHMREHLCARVRKFGFDHWGSKWVCIQRFQTCF